MKYLALAILLTGCAAPKVASATMNIGSITHDLSIGPVGWEERVFNVPKFNPVLGTLQSIDITASVHDDWYQSVEYQCQSMPGSGAIQFSNHSFTVLMDGSYECLGAGGGIGAFLTADNSFDGVLDGSGASGQHVIETYEYSLGQTQLLRQRQLDTFTGNGTKPLRIKLYKSAWYNEEPGTCPYHSIASDNSYTYHLTVTYNYN